MPSASAGAPSVSRLIQRIWVASSGTAIASPVSSSPSAPAEHDAEEHREHLADVRREQEAQELRMFAKMPRPSRIAATIVAKLSSARIMSAASLATSVPAMPIATPMSAAFSAGASFTPSPVIATIRPSAWSASTIRSLCSGATRA